MAEKTEFAVVELSHLMWPTSLQLPASRFRLFVAADTTDTTTEMISDFASAALGRGMVYFCAWGLGCDRFHDIVDEVIVEDDLGERRFASYPQGRGYDDVARPRIARGCPGLLRNLRRACGRVRAE